MSFESSFMAGVGLVGLLSAFFIGLALAISILALLRLGDGKGASRISLIIVACSFAIATGAWVFVLAVRNNLGFPEIQWYALAGLAIGLSGGVFPRLVGIPVLTLAVLAIILGASEMTAWHRWRDGLRIVELKIYAADEGSSLCGLSLPDRNSVPVLQNLRLVPGPLVLEIEALVLEGPLAFFFGTRHYRLVSLGVDTATADAGAAIGRAGNDTPSIHVFPFRRGILDAGGRGSPLMGYLGFSRLRLRSVPLPAEDLAQGSYILEVDGSLASIIR